jgi:uncharacterized protein YndB with AHSA1/START domain
VASEPVVKEIYMEAPPAVLFGFLTDPVKMLRGIGIRAQIDPRPGGIFCLDPNGRDVIRGEYVEVIPDSRVVSPGDGKNRGVLCRPDRLPSKSI